MFQSCYLLRTADESWECGTDLLKSGYSGYGGWFAATGAILQGQLKGNPIYNLGDYSRSNLNNPDDEKLHFRHKTLLKQQLHLSAL